MVTLHLPYVVCYPVTRLRAAQDDQAEYFELQYRDTSQRYDAYMRSTCRARPCSTWGAVSVGVRSAGWIWARRRLRTSTSIARSSRLAVRSCANVTPLNMLSLRQIRRIMRASPFQLQQCRVYGFSGRSNRLSPLLAPLVKVPILEELMHSYYSALLVKPSRSGSRNATGNSANARQSDPP
jgi:hypothetical protein